MISPKDNKNTSFIHRTAEKAPTHNISHFLIGRPLQTADASHHTINKRIGFAFFASDALSSTAYATHALLAILSGGRTLAFGYVPPISLVNERFSATVDLSYCWD